MSNAVVCHAKQLSSGTIATLAKEENWNLIVDTNRYENIDRIQNAFVAFLISMNAAAHETGVSFPYDTWQAAWKGFKQTRHAYDALGIVP